MSAGAHSRPPEKKGSTGLRRGSRPVSRPDPKKVSDGLRPVQNDYPGEGYPMQDYEPDGISARDTAPAVMPDSLQQEYASQAETEEYYDEPASAPYDESEAEHDSGIADSADDDNTVSEEDYSEPEEATESEPVRNRASEGQNGPGRGHRTTKGGMPQKNNSMKKRKKKKKMNGGAKVILILSIVAFFLAVLAAGAYYAGTRITESAVNLPNVYIDGISVGNLTPEQTAAKLQREGWEETNSAALTVTLPRDISFQIGFVDCGANFSTQEVVDRAYAYGHSGTVMENFETYVTGFMRHHDVGSESRTLKGDVIYSAVDAAIEQFNAANADNGYKVDHERNLLLLEKGAGQISINRDDFIDKVIKALQVRGTELSYEPETNLKTPDFAKIYLELAVEPANAYYDAKAEAVVDEVYGVKFNVNAAEKLWNNAEVYQTVEIPVELEAPEITGEFLRSVLFRDQLAIKETSLSGSSKQRINNITLVAQIIDGYVLMPGEEFSYNDVVGQRTEERGFQAAPAYDDDKVVYEYGGGVCQVSSTLYYCSLCTNLEILQRTEHGFSVAYLNPGLDATVSWPKPNYIFKNNRDFPIKILASINTDNNTLHIEFWGTNLDGTYIEPKSGWWKLYDEVYTSTQIGIQARTWLEVYDAEGNLIDNIDIGYSTYALHPEDIEWPPEYYLDQESDDADDEEVEISG